MKPYRIFVVVQPGLEDVAEREIQELGYKDLVRIKGGFFLAGHLSTVMKLNFACRCISRVLIEIAEFEAKSFAQLESHLNEINWQDYLHKQKVCIHVSSYQSSLYHEKAIAERVINTLADTLQKTITVVGSPDEDHTQLIAIYAKHDKFVVRMDTSGAHLHKRGYSLLKEEAPLRETLASGMLYAIGWTETVQNLHDPMCGSGTIVTEAALMARKIPWCEYRNFAFEGWGIFNQDIYDKIRKELLGKVIEHPTVTITAGDMDGKSITSAKINMRKANLEDAIIFNTVKLSEKSVDRNCVIVTNPPWGKRLGIDSIQTLWNELSYISRRGQDVFFILPETQEPEFEYTYKTMLRFDAGGIKVKFIELED
jgi:putative N6-adenine-specific DNA methylase